MSAMVQRVLPGVFIERENKPVDYPSPYCNSGVFTFGCDDSELTEKQEPPDLRSTKPVVQE